MAHHHFHNYRQATGVSPAVILLCIIVNLVFVAVEAMAGFYGNSSALLSDAGHNLGDVLGLLLSFVAISLEQHKHTERLSHWITLSNGLLLLVTMLLVLSESVSALLVPSQVKGNVVIFTAMSGIIINGFTVLVLLGSGRKSNINIRVAYLHALSDMLVSVGVVLSGVVVHFTGYDLIDPIASICISVSISVATVKLVCNAIKNIKMS